MLFTFNSIIDIEIDIVFEITPFYSFNIRSRTIIMIGVAHTTISFVWTLDIEFIPSQYIE